MERVQDSTKSPLGYYGPEFHCINIKGEGLPTQTTKIPIGDTIS